MVLTGHIHDALVLSAQRDKRAHGRARLLTALRDSPQKLAACKYPSIWRGVCVIFITLFSSCKSMYAGGTLPLAQHLAAFW